MAPSRHTLYAHFVAGKRLHVISVINRKRQFVALDRHLVHTVVPTVEDAFQLFRFAGCLAQGVTARRNLTQKTLLLQQDQHVVHVCTVAAAENAKFL